MPLLMFWNGRPKIRFSQGHGEVVHNVINSLGEFLVENNGGMSVSIIKTRNKSNCGLVY